MEQELSYVSKNAVLQFVNYIINQFKTSKDFEINHTAMWQDIFTQQYGNTLVNKLLDDNKKLITFPCVRELSEDDNVLIQNLINIVKICDRMFWNKFQAPIIVSNIELALYKNKISYNNQYLHMSICSYIAHAFVKGAFNKIFYNIKIIKNNHNIFEYIYRPTNSKGFYRFEHAGDYYFQIINNNFEKIKI